MTRDSRLVTETATLAGGCFWCLEAVFERLKGVHSVTSGYIGGTMPEPTYRAVCSGITGHAEAVQLVFDPATLSYRDLLLLFFGFHDPTTLNRQGPDLGTQYRSAVFFHSPDQEETARAVIQELIEGKVFEDPIVTEVTPATTFWPAEEYHREYYRRNPDQAYCRAMISPKVARLRERFTQLLKPEPA